MLEAFLGTFRYVSVTWNITKFPFLKYEENSLSEYIRAFFYFLNLGLKVHQQTIVAKRFVIYCWQYSENYRVLNVFFPKYQKTLKLFWEHLTNIFRAGLLKKKIINFFRDKFWGLRPKSVLSSDSDSSRIFSGMCAQKSQHL